MFERKKHDLTYCLIPLFPYSPNDQILATAD